MGGGNTFTYDFCLFVENNVASYAGDAIPYIAANNYANVTETLQKTFEYLLTLFQIASRKENPEK